MPNVRCAVCKRLQRLPNQDRKYILVYSRFICSWSCALKWIKKQIPLDGKYTPQQMWGAIPVNEGGAYADFKSDFERKVATVFDLEGIDWQYEKWMFEVGQNGHYTPDFWLPKFGSFIEVKGMWWTTQRRKFDKFTGQYSKVPIMLFNWLLKPEVDKIITNSGGASWRNRKII